MASPPSPPPKISKRDRLKQLGKTTVKRVFGRSQHSPTLSGNETANTPNETLHLTEKRLEDTIPSTSSLSSQNSSALAGPSSVHNLNEASGVPENVFRAARSDSAGLL